MPHQGIAEDHTVLIAGFDAERTVVLPSWQKLRAEAVTGGLVRPLLPGVDCVALPGAHRHPPRRRMVWLSRFVRHGLPLIVGVIAVTCLVVLFATVQP